MRMCLNSQTIVNIFPLIADVILIVIAGLGGTSLGVMIHENTHYKLGERYNGDPEFDYLETGLPCVTGIPKSVNYNNISELSNNQISVTGGATIVWTLLFLLVVYLIRLPATHIETLIFCILFGSAWFSPSDMLASLFPQLWIEYANLDPRDRTHRKALEYLIRGFRNIR